MNLPAAQDKDDNADYTDCQYCCENDSSPGKRRTGLWLSFL